MKPSVNYWPHSTCARVFWSQHELPPYQELLGDTAVWLDPGPQERWLDLGCGGGQLTRVLWEQSRGLLGEIVGLDCAAANQQAFEKLRTRLQPRPGKNQIRFLAADFSKGLEGWEEGAFDGVVSGLAISYAESYSADTGCWTDQAYDHILREVARVLRPGGRFIFSVNVPEPSWGRVAWKSLAGMWKASRPLHFLKRAWRLWSYGNWLKRESRRGRFHYFPVETIRAKLEAAGFTNMQHRLSFAGQAYVFRCRRGAAVRTGMPSAVHAAA